MIIYFAGNTATPTRDKQLVEHGANRLFSFYYHNDQAHFHIDWLGYLKEVNDRDDREILSSSSS